MRDLTDEIHAAYPEFVQQGRADMEHFARFVVEKYESGEREALTPAFSIMEVGLVEGDPGVRDEIVVGFLEGLQNIASHRPYGAVVFREYLGERSREAWEELNVTWQDKHSLAEVVADETGASLRPPWWPFWRSRQSAATSLPETVERPR